MADTKKFLYFVHTIKIKLLMLKPMPVLIVRQEEIFVKILRTLILSEIGNF